MESRQIILELAWKPAFQILALTLDMSKLFNFLDVKLLHLWNWKNNNCPLGEIQALNETKQDTHTVDWHKTESESALKFSSPPYSLSSIRHTCPLSPTLFLSFL